VLGQESAKGVANPVIHLKANNIVDTVEDSRVGVYPKSNRIMASGMFRPSFGEGRYTVYSCVDFPGAKVLKMGDSRSGAGETSTAYGYAQIELPENNKVLVRVGVSFLSAERACQNMERELGTPDFDKTVSTAQKAWREKLNVIHVKPSNVQKGIEKTFWSGFYRAMISPQDLTGENLRWESKEPYYESFYWLVLLLPSNSTG
jgi:hypothetical protein